MKSSGPHILELEGAVSIHLAQELVRRAKRVLESGQSVTLDCERVEFIDTAALQILLALREGLKSRGLSLFAVEVPAPMKPVFQAAGLAQGE